MWSPATLAARSRAGVSTTLTSFTLAREVVALHVGAADITCSHADVATAVVTRGALEGAAVAVAALHMRGTMTSLRAARTMHSRERARVERTLSLIAGRVPPAPLDVGRPATLTAWSRAGVSATLASSALAGEEIALHVRAAYIACSNAHVATAAVSRSALEGLASSVVALHWRGTLASL